MPANTCSICSRSIIWIRTAIGVPVACDPTEYDLAGSASNFDIVYTAEGRAIMKGTAFPGSLMKGYRPHFVTCDVFDSRKDPITLALWSNYSSVSGLPPPEGGELP